MSSAEPPQTPLTPMSPCFSDTTFQESEPGSPMSTALTLVGDDYTPILRSPKFFVGHDSSAPLVTPDRRRPESARIRQFSYMLRQLAPLLSIETGTAHPRFPRTMLHYHLLTEPELDELAQFYHQRTPTAFSLQYPMPVVSRWDASPTDSELSGLNNATVKLRGILGFSAQGDNLQCLCRLNNKRRRFGRFIGLQEMESAGLDMEGSMREEMERWVEREMRARENRDRELEAWRSKMF